MNLVLVMSPNKCWLGGWVSLLIGMLSTDEWLWMKVIEKGCVYI